MGKYDEIKKEIEELVEQGQRLHSGLSIFARKYTKDPQETTTLSDQERDDVTFFLRHYETWYSEALHAIKQLLPERTDDFISLYKDAKRKEITWQNYTISDAVQGKATSTHSFHPGNATRKMFQQVAMVSTCLERFDKKIFDIQTILQADVFDSEIDSAKHLTKMGFYRAAGAICGVILEKHFCAVCANRSLVIKKRNPTISDYNDSLKDVAYDTIEWRRIQRLGDIRNLCDHSKEREPSKDEIEELISGTEHIIKTIF